MRLIVAVVVLVGFVEATRRRQSSSGSHVGSSAEGWEAWKSKHGKEYRTKDEEAQRLRNYLNNRRYIASHNSRVGSDGEPSASHSLGENEFMDMSLREFVSIVNGFKAKYGRSLAKGHGHQFLSPLNMGPIPTEVDWRQKGYVTPVKNQGHCGSCWAFSTTGSLEGQTFRKTGKLVSLSEQNLVDCSTPFGNQGCNGGLMDQAFQYIKHNDGLDKEVAYPYEARDDKCRFKKTTVGAEDVGFVDVAPVGNETALQIALATVGPISIAIDASQQSFMLYKSGVYVEPACSSDQLDHGVLLVGYGTENGEDYWLVKNSWGTSWGEAGYIKMGRNLNNQCGVASSASYPLV